VQTSFKGSEMTQRYGATDRGDVGSVMALMVPSEGIPDRGGVIMRSPRGSIRQRGRESWELSVRVGSRRETRTIRAADRSAAESALLDCRRELRDEGVPESDPLVRELAAEWLGVVSTRVKERTATRYR
jgi:hypothetical protein